MKPNAQWKCLITASPSRKLFSGAGWLLLVFTAATGFAQLPVPQLKALFPTGGRQGATNEVELSGANLDDVTKLYFTHSQITSEFLTNKPIRFRVTIGNGVAVGDYDVRCIGKYGISNPRAFVVSDCAEITEAEPNNTRTNAGRVTLNTIVNGHVHPAEDVDWFVFAAKAGQRLLIECRAWRIDSRLDGVLWLFDRHGKQLAMSQDEDIRDEKRDPFLDFDVPTDGDYFVKLSDFTFSGNEEHFYRLSIGAPPYIDFVMPCAVSIHSTVTVFGRNLPAGEDAAVSVKGRPLQKTQTNIVLRSEGFGETLRPAASRFDVGELRIKNEFGTSNAKPLLLSQLPQLLEREPNNATNEAQRLQVPCGITGQFSPTNDVDYFVFTAKKDERFVVQVSSERISSPADPDLEILKPDGNLLANPQDDGENIGQIRFATNGRDIYHSFTVPADGDYTLRLEHLYRQGQGGPQYLYYMELQRDPAPDFRLVCQPPHEIAIDSHVVYAGGRQRLDVLAWRLFGHDEPITVTATNLPAGITADSITLGKGVKWGTLVLSAAPDARPTESEIHVIGASEAKGQKLIHHARGGVIVWDTVNTPAISRVTRSIMLAVREKAPFALTASPVEFNIKKGEPLEITIKAMRREDLSGSIQLTGAGYQLPPGIEIPLTKLDSGQPEAKLTLKTDKMPEGVFSFIINGEAQVPSGKDKTVRCLYPTNPIRVKLEPVETKKP